MENNKFIVSAQGEEADEVVKVVDDVLVWRKSSNLKLKFISNTLFSILK